MSSSELVTNSATETFKTNILTSTLELARDMFAEEGIKLSLFFVIFSGFQYSDDKKKRYWLSWLVVCIIFGLLHLDTYGNNWAQCIIAIGIPTMLYGYLWKKTEEPLLMWLTHFLYDFILFLLFA